MCPCRVGSSKFLKVLVPLFWVCFMLKGRMSFEFPTTYAVVVASLAAMAITMRRDLLHQAVAVSNDEPDKLARLPERSGSACDDVLR
jgi:hypothetical protein